MNLHTNLLARRGRPERFFLKGTRMRRWKVGPASILLKSLVVACLAMGFGTWAPARAQDAKKSAVEPQYVNIPVKGAGLFGGSVDMVTEVFTPAGSGPFPVLVYAHGRDGTQQERSAMREVIPRDYLQYWLAKGFAVVAPMRPGYGKTGGMDRELPGHSWDNFGGCSGSPNVDAVVATSGAAILAALEWTRQQSWANASAVLLSGNSVGGLTVVAVGANNPTGVIGYVNFVGGVAGNPTRSPGKSCDPDRVREAFRTYGSSTKLPNLWLYAENDLYWGSAVPKAWHAAFAAGGSPSTFVMTPPVPGPDGHDLIFRGRSLWSGHTDAFLKQVGM